MILYTENPKESIKKLLKLVRVQQELRLETDIKTNKKTTVASLYTKI